MNFFFVLQKNRYGILLFFSLFLSFILLLIPSVQAQEDYDLLWEYESKYPVLDISITSNGSYISAICGDKLLFLNNEGEVIWASEVVSQANDVEISPDGSYIVVLCESTNTFHFFDKEGKLLWSSEKFKRIDDLAITSDGNVAVGGIRSSDTYCDYPVYFFNREGKILWKSETAKKGGKLSISPDGSVIAVFAYETENRDGHIYKKDRLYLLDSQGDLINRYGIDFPVEDIAVSSGGSYLALCNNKRLELLKISGNSIWEYETARPISNIEMTSTGSLLVCMNNKIDYFDTKGNLLWSKNIYSASDVEISSDGSIIAATNGNICLFSGFDFVNLFVEKVSATVESLKLKGFDMSSEESLLSQAETSLSKGDYGKAFELSNIAKNFNLENIENPVEKARKEVEFEKTRGFNASSAESLLNKAGEALKKGNSEKAFKYSEQVETLVLKFREAYDYIQDVNAMVSSEKTKGFNVSSAESLLSLAKQSLNNGNYEQVFELGGQAQKIIIDIENAYNFTQEVSVLVDSEASKGFDVSPAESLLSQAENSLVDKGDYKRALYLANQAKTLTPDIDNDGLPNKNDFAPSINNNYLYAGAGVLLIAVFLSILAFLIKFNRSTQEIKKLKEEKENKKEHEMVLAEEVKVSFSKDDFFSSDNEFEKLSYDYEFIELLGEGGFAKVFRVKRKHDDKVIALKLPRIDENTSSYFMKEVATWYTLNHPNIVKLYRADYSPVPHIEMECIEGVQKEGKLIRDLEKYPKPLPEDEAVRIIRGIGEGLRYAHEKGIYHNDLKPLNILLQGEKSQIIPKITDFSLARVESKTSITKRNAFSPLYAAPEQLDSEKYGDPDQRTDIYHLGIIFYNLLSGDLPYNGSSPVTVLAKIVSEDVSPDPISKLHSNLSHYNGIFEKLLAKEKENRYHQVNEFLSVLDSLLEVEKERQDLKKSLEITRNTIKISAGTEVIKRLKIEVVEKTVKVLILCIKTNDKAGLINSLEDLTDYTEKYKEDLNSVIIQLEYMLKEGILVGVDFEESLKVLLHKIEREVMVNNNS